MTTEPEATADADSPASVQLDREHYFDFGVQHFREKVREVHASY